MSPRCRKQIESEAEYLSTLNHGKVIKYFGTCLEEKTIVMEKMGMTMNTSDSHGKVNNVREYLDELVDEIIDCNTRIKIALDAARGLEHLHLNGIVHRDFKWSNLLVKEEANVMLTKVRRRAIFFFSMLLRKEHYF